MDQVQDRCSLLVFVATPTEEREFLDCLTRRTIGYRKIPNHPELGAYYWIPNIGNETLILIPPAKDENRELVMGYLGWLGTAARGIRLRNATSAQAIVQVGMAFGVDEQLQSVGDVVISSSIIPYDNRLIVGDDGYRIDYSGTKSQIAREALVGMLQHEIQHGNHSFQIHFGAILSGGARIRSRKFRDELVAHFPAEKIVGGEMEGVGLLSAATEPDNPVWCIVKGISDFAEEKRSRTFKQNRTLACRNAAELLISALVRQAKPE